MNKYSSLVYLLPPLLVSPFFEKERKEAEWILERARLSLPSCSSLAPIFVRHVFYSNKTINERVSVTRNRIAKTRRALDKTSWIIVL